MAKEKKEGPLPPLSDHRISLGDARELVRRYRRYSAPAAEKGGFFWADPVRRLLAQKGVVGLRYYHGVDEKGGYHIILCGVDKDGRDIVRQVVGGSPTAAKGGAKKAMSSMALAAGGDDLLEEHFPCPPFCPPDGPFA
jgi:hypothetical protein